ncbi:MAG: AI-2E family transporter [Bacteroidetes bacterium]|nr:AI-2E family transporter [Bacteroidota bacterium]
MIQLKDKTRSILLVIGFLFVIFLLWYFSAIVTYILISVVLAFIGKPLVRWITLLKYKKFKIPKGFAAFITLGLLWAVFISFFRFIIPLLVNQLDTLSQIDFTVVLNSIEEPVVEFLQFFSKSPVVFENHTFTDIVTKNIADKIDFSQLSDLFAVIAGTIGEVLIAFFSVSFITFFFLKEETMFREVIILLVPTNYELKVVHILDSISNLLSRYFVGLIFEVFMVMVLVSLGLTIVGIEFSQAVVIGLFCGMFNVIPYLGPWMGAAVGLLIGAALNIDSDFMSQTLPLLGFMVIVFGSVQIIDNILFQPLIYSSSVKAHPLEIFLVILAAGSLAGIVGMILAIPVYTILRVIAKEFFDNMKIVKKLTENLEQQKGE